MNKYIIVFLMSMSSSLVMSMSLDEALSKLGEQKEAKTLQRNDFEMKPLSTSQKKEAASKIVVSENAGLKLVAGIPVPQVTEKKPKRVRPKNYLARSADFDINKQACSFLTYMECSSDSWLLDPEEFERRNNLSGTEQENH